MASETGPSVRIERALLSVDDKSGLGELGRGLAELGVELWATGGTRTALAKASVPVHSAEELTGIGAWFGGRVKTLHPGILGGILAPRTDAGRAELAERGLRAFDLVVVNFYPFERHLLEAPHATDREEYVNIVVVSSATQLSFAPGSNVVLTLTSQFAPAWMSYYAGLNLPGVTYSCAPAASVACTGPYNGNGALATVVLSVPTTSLVSLSVTVALFALSIQ